MLEGQGQTERLEVFPVEQQVGQQLLLLDPLVDLRRLLLQQFGRIVFPQDDGGVRASAHKLRLLFVG